MQKTTKRKNSEIKGAEPVSFEKCIYIRFGIKLGHSILGQDNFTELDDKIHYATGEMCMKHFRDTVVDMAREFNISVPTALPMLTDIDEMGEALAEVLNGYRLAKEGAPADCNLFLKKL